MIENEQHPIQRVILVGLERERQQTDDFKYQMTELANLAEANYMEVVQTVTQKADRPNPGTYFGKGKVEELKEAVEYNEADVVLTNDELSPSQIRNLEAGTGAQIMDRTALILDIFSSRAKTKIAKLQVAIAQLQYQLPRLRTSMNVRLDQQSGGSGSFTSRGAGETQLEINKRHIQHKISELRQELAEIEVGDQTRRAKRTQEEIKNVALIGYTNAGKSTIMNGLVKQYGENQEKTVFQADMLFATLETSVRKLNLPDKRTFLLSDTVGFVSKLPHGLVASFKATLAEAAQSDLLVQVVDYADPHYQDMMATTERTLAEIGVHDIPMITVYNKADKLVDVAYPTRDGEKITISAVEPSSLDLLLQTITEKIFADNTTVTVLVPFSEGQVVTALNDHATILETEYLENGTQMTVTVSPRQLARFSEYVVEESN